MNAIDMLYRISAARNLGTLEARLGAHGLPVVPSLEFAGRKMQLLDGQYYYVFAWVDGTALSDAEITPAHCETIGALLALGCL